MLMYKAHRNIGRIAEFLPNIGILCAPYSPKYTVITHYRSTINTVAMMLCALVEGRKVCSSHTLTSLLIDS